MQDSKPKTKGKFLALEPWEQYQYRYALILEYRSDRAYRNIIEQDLKPLWHSLPASEYVTPAHPDFEGDPLPFNLWQCENRLLYGDSNPRLRLYVDKLYTVVRTRMCLARGAEPARWAAGFVHAEVTAGEYGPFDPGVGMSYRTFEAALKLEVSPARAHVRMVQRYDPTSPSMEPTNREHELGSRHIEAARGYSFEEWDQLEAQMLDLYRAWATNMRAFWGKNYQYRYAGTVEEKRNDIHRLFLYLFKGETIDIVDRVIRLRLQRLAKSLEIDLPKHAQKRRPK